MFKMNGLRLNNIIQYAIETSPQSRQIHEKYFINEGFYTYTTVENSFVPAFVKQEKGKTLLALNMRYRGDLLASKTHHELIHIAQFAREREMSLPDIKLETPHVYLAASLIREAHAFTGGVEGPLFGFFNDIEQGNMNRIPFYKSKFTIDPVPNKFLPIYYQSLFNQSAADISSDNLIDSAGLLYLNSFRYLEKEEKKECVMNARHAVLSEFFSPRETNDGIKNNSVVDYYIGDAITLLNSHFEKAKNTYGENRLDKIFVDNMSDPTRQERTLQQTLATTNTLDETFIEDESWYAIIKAKDNKEFVSYFLEMSKYKKSYEQLVNNINPKPRQIYPASKP